MAELYIDVRSSLVSARLFYTKSSSIGMKSVYNC